MAQATGHVKLTDFGLSVAHQHTKKGKGTLPYMAPESLRGEEEGTAALDLWACGVALHEMTTGMLPFRGYDGPQQMLDAIGAEMDGRGAWLPCGGLSAFARTNQLSEAAVQLCVDLLRWESASRPSCHAVRGHPFFEGVRWDQIEQETPPFVPDLASPNDTSYFEGGPGYDGSHAARVSDESSSE